MSAPETTDEAFARGQAQGEVNARLNNHDLHLTAHDVAIAQIGPQMASLTGAPARQPT